MFTKGKWLWKQNRGNNIYEHSVFVADSAGDKIIAELTGGTMRGCTAGEIKANARLIAAAPELRAACKMALVHATCQDEIKMLTAALDNAEN